MASEEDIQGTKDAVIQDLERKLRFKEDVLNNGQPVPGVCGLSRGRGESGAAPLLPAVRAEPAAGDGGGRAAVRPAQDGAGSCTERGTQPGPGAGREKGPRGAVCPTPRRQRPGSTGPDDVRACTQRAPWGGDSSAPSGKTAGVQGESGSPGCGEGERCVGLAQVH